MNVLWLPDIWNQWMERCDRLEAYLRLIQEEEPPGMNAPTSTASREFTHTRTLKAPLALVYKVWTDPKHIDQWWGPAGFRNETLEMNVVPGGVWRYIMHGPEGMDFPCKVTYTKVVPNERLEYGLGADDDQPPHFEVTVTFEEKDGLTTFSMRGVFPTVEAFEAVKKYGAIEKGAENMDRGVAYVASLQEGA